MFVDASLAEVCVHTGKKHDILLCCHANAAALPLSFSVQLCPQLIFCQKKFPTLEHTGVTAPQGDAGIVTPCFTACTCLLVADQDTAAARTGWVFLTAEVHASGFALLLVG